LNESQSYPAAIGAPSPTTLQGCGVYSVTARATMRTGDLNRLLKAAKAHGFMVERHPDGVMRLIPAGDRPLTDPANTPPSSDPLDAELAEWMQKHGYG
jgi:hypothetical protein